ncbi:MAG: hypothetical protein EOP45_13815 [Sphingobacteriaceae bacterium]|nr:MAG: hypothetical protein EOP45_13815 [Sphingobacteriaceae bacterium]
MLCEDEQPNRHQFSNYSAITNHLKQNSGIAIKIRQITKNQIMDDFELDVSDIMHEDDNNTGSEFDAADEKTL